MSYTRQCFESGAVLYASQLNAMDEKIAQLDAAVADLTYEEIAVKTFVVTPYTAEIGSSVSSVTFSYALNAVPASLNIGGVAVTNPTKSGSIVRAVSTSSDKSWTLVATDSRGASATKTASLAFLNRIYYGAAEPPGVLDDFSSFILGLSDSVLASSKARTINVTAGSGKFIWYAVPSRMGNCSFTVGGFEGGFTRVATVSHTNASSYTEDYDIWKSDNAGLGSVKVVIS